MSSLVLAGHGLNTGSLRKLVKVSSTPSSENPKRALTGAVPNTKPFLRYMLSSCGTFCCCGSLSVCALMTMRLEPLGSEWQATHDSPLPTFCW